MPKNADGPTTFRMEFGFRGAVRAMHPYVPPPTSAEMNKRQKARAAQTAAVEKAARDLVTAYPRTEQEARELVERGVPAQEIIERLKAKASQKERRSKALRCAHCRSGQR